MTKAQVKLIRGSAAPPQAMMMHLELDGVVVDRTTINDIRTFKSWRHVL